MHKKLVKIARVVLEISSRTDRHTETQAYSSQYSRTPYGGEVLNVTTTSHPFILLLVVFPKALFSALYSSSCTLPLSVLWSLPFPSTTIFTQMTLSSSSLSTHLTLTQASLTFKTLFNISLPRWLLIFLLITPLRLNYCSSDSKNNSPKYLTLHLTPPTLLEILASSLTNILSSPTKLHLSPNPATITFVSFAVSGLTSIPHLPVPLLPLSFTPNSKLDYCNSLYYKLSKIQLSRFQQIQNSLVRTVVKAPTCGAEMSHDARSQKPRKIRSRALPRLLSARKCLALYCVVSYRIVLWVSGHEKSIEYVIESKISK